MKNIFEFPRRSYSHTSTPLEPCSNLQRQLPSDAPTIYIKRDDLLGLTGGGNKTRKLEFLIADALHNKCDTIITCGAIQSNHCRLTLAAAKIERLECHLVLEERVENTFSSQASGNNFLFHLLGAESIKVYSKSTNLMEAMENLAEDLKKKGKKPYIIPGGGSNPLGACGYVACAHELMNQATEMKLRPSHLVTTSGSAGTHAGLIVGLKILNVNLPVIGVSVNKKNPIQVQNVTQLAQETSRFLELSEDIVPEDVQVFDDQIGHGYSIPTDEMIKAIKLLANTEGILLDPVYTGKAFAGLLALIEKKYFSSKDVVIFIHTGGAPALYAYHNLWLNNTPIENHLGPQ